METRYCIEYINPRHPLCDNGNINVRYDRVLTLEQAEHDLTLILSFGAKILNLYMGNVIDGKTGEWSSTPMIVDDDDWVTIDWLKSLKDRVQPQSKQEWSEEDEYIIEEIEAIIDAYVLEENNPKALIDWCKSLKDRYTWKPSKGQLECLSYAIDKAEKDYSPLTNNRIYLTLKTLKEELEKL